MSCAVMNFVVMNFVVMNSVVTSDAAAIFRWHLACQDKSSIIVKTSSP